MRSVEIAQLNIARALAPLDDPLMDGFVGRLAEINELAEKTRGFVWRLTDKMGADATGIRAYDDPLVIVNLSVWTGIDELSEFAYRSAHVEMLRARRDWFAPFEGPSMALWWVPAGVRPAIEDATARLEYLAEHGPTPYAFTFKARFGPDWTGIDRGQAVGAGA